VHGAQRRRDQNFGPAERQEIRDRIAEVQRSWSAETERSRRLTFATDLPGGRNHVRRERQWDRRANPASSQDAPRAAAGRQARAW
jgi:hypothetical protein